MSKSLTLLRALRANQQPKITQETMARRVAAILGRGFSQARYWQIETGERPAPSPDERKAIAAVLRVKVADIAWPEVQQSMAS